MLSVFLWEKYQLKPCEGFISWKIFPTNMGSSKLVVFVLPYRYGQSSACIASHLERTQFKMYGDTFISFVSRRFIVFIISASLSNITLSVLFLYLPLPSRLNKKLWHGQGIDPVRAISPKFPATTWTNSQKKLKYLSVEQIWTVQSKRFFSKNFTTSCRAFILDKNVILLQKHSERIQTSTRFLQCPESVHFVPKALVF